MAEFKRYAVFALPEGAWADWATAWLGWDAVAGRAVPHPALDGLPMEISDLTATPRRYGLHATLKPPFRLADGRSAQALTTAFKAFCAARGAPRLSGLDLRQMGGFLALMPTGDAAALDLLAADIVARFDRFRAPPTQAELARRRARRLSPTQEAMLTQWGYPFVMDEFRFHITLTGKLPPAIAERCAAVLDRHLTPLLPRPYTLAALGLCGEDAAGRFHLLHRAALAG